MNKKSIDLLNKAIADELSAIHQCIYFYFHCNNPGLDLFANLFKRTAIDKRTHVEELTERILFLNGEVEIMVVHRWRKSKM